MEESFHLSLHESLVPPGEEWCFGTAGWRLLLVRDGTLYWMARQKALDLREGSALLLTPAAHGCLRASVLGTARFCYFSLEPGELAGLLSVRDRLTLDAIAREQAERLVPAGDPAAQAFARLAGRSLHSESAFARIRFLSLLSMVLGDAPLLESPAPAKLASTQRRFEELMERLSDADLMRHDSGELAAMCGSSVRHFRRMFRQKFKTSFRSHHVALRLEKARRLLAETEDEVSAIAHAAGFHHLGLFNKMFKRWLGLTPTEWRRQHRCH